MIGFEAFENNGVRHVMKCNDCFKKISNKYNDPVNYLKSIEYFYHYH